MAGMTKLQKKYVEDIEKNLDIKFERYNTRKGADIFIKKHAAANKKFKLENNKQFPPTGRQLRTIKAIEATLGVKFNGRTTRTAKKFIKKHYKEFENKRSEWHGSKKYKKAVFKDVYMTG